MQPSSTNHPNASFFSLTQTILPRQTQHSFARKVNSILLFFKRTICCWPLAIGKKRKRQKHKANGQSRTAERSNGVLRQAQNDKSFGEHRRANGGYSVGEPPLPIPNREVKPYRADGTAVRWESRSLPIFIKPVQRNLDGLFLFMRGCVFALSAFSHWPWAVGFW